MLKDIFRGKEIDNKAQLIAVTIVASYPSEEDRHSGAGKRAGSEADKKLSNAISKGRALIVNTSKAMDLGFYGKAKLCKHIQRKLLELGSSMDTTFFIVKELVVALTSK